MPLPCLFVYRLFVCLSCLRTSTSLFTVPWPNTWSLLTPTTTLIELTVPVDKLLEKPRRNSEGAVKELVHHTNVLEHKKRWILFFFASLSLT